MKKIELPKVTDERGTLSFFESERHIPFKIGGIYLLNIYSSHDQYTFIDNSNTEFFFIALSGSFVFKHNSTDNLVDSICLKNANQGLYITGSTDFILSQFSENTVVLIISSTEKFNIRRI